MASSDSIADMLTIIRNGIKAKFTKVDIPNSKIKHEISKILKNEGYIKNFKIINDNKQGILRIYLKYLDNNVSSINKLIRISKPGRRMYRKAKEIKSVLNGYGIAIISTSKGVMTDKFARENNVGGEVLCSVW